MAKHLQARENTLLAKHLQGDNKRKLFGIENLEDAYDAGTINSKNCTLIITDSA